TGAGASWLRAQPWCSHGRRRFRRRWNRAGPWRALEQHAHAPELLIALLQQLLDRHVVQLAQMAEQISLEHVGHLAVVAVGAAERLGNDVVDDAEANRSRAVNFSASAAKGRVCSFASFQRMPAQPSGLITE